MRFIIGCNEKMFYWREYTGEVVWTSDDRHYEVIGYAKMPVSQGKMRLRGCREEV